MIAISVSILGLCLIIAAFQNLSRRLAQSKSNRWPSVKGHVTACRTDPIYVRGIKRNMPMFRYDYEVSGRHYEGRCVFARAEYPQWNSIEKYPNGSEVIVYYNPETATYSCLQPRINGITHSFASWTIFSILNTILAAVGAAVICWGFNFLTN